MRKPGRRTFAQSFRDAGRGVLHCLKAERSMRVHLGAIVLVMVAGALCRVGPAQWAGLLLAMGMVTAAEAMNTAIERLCDFVQGEQDPRIGIIKDIAAGGVLLAAVFAAAVGAAVFLPAGWKLVALVQQII